MANIKLFDELAAIRKVGETAAKRQAALKTIESLDPMLILKLLQALQEGRDLLVGILNFAKKITGAKGDAKIDKILNAISSLKF